MYLIANVSLKEVMISDINISLNLRQSIDLHKVKTSINPQDSQDLKKAIKSGLIKILYKDQYKKIVQQTKKDNSQQIDQKQLIDTLKQQLAKQSQAAIKSATDAANASNADLMRQMMQMMKSMSMGQLKYKQDYLTVKKQQTNQIKEKQIQINQQVLRKIHQKSMDKIKNGRVTEGSINIQSKRQNNDIGELSDLDDII